MGVFGLLSFIVHWSVQAFGDSLDWLALDQIAARVTTLFEASRRLSANAKSQAPVPAPSSRALQA